MTVRTRYRQRKEGRSTKSSGSGSVAWIVAVAVGIGDVKYRSGTKGAASAAAFLPWLSEAVFDHMLVWCNVTELTE